MCVFYSRTIAVSVANELHTPFSYACNLNGLVLQTCSSFSHLPLRPYILANIITPMFLLTIIDVYLLFDWMFIFGSSVHFAVGTSELYAMVSKTMIHIFYAFSPDN